LRNLNPAADIIPKNDFLKDLKKHFAGRDGLPILPATHDHFHQHHNINQHSDRISATMLRASTPILRHQLDMFLDLLLSAHSDHVLRIKGLVQLVGENRPLVIQGVGNRLSEPYYLKNWPSEVHSTQLVVFLEDLKPDFVQRLFAGFLNTPQIDTPDSSALTASPLSIAGFSPTKKN
jgi:G3E family GTPase